MRIKPASKKHLRIARLRATGTHWWLVPEPPRKKSRLKQLNKHNNRVKSEFVLMAERIENERSR